MAKIDKLLERAKEHLHKGEEPLQTVLGTYEAKAMGQDDFIREGIFGATNQRLLLYSKKLRGFELEAFPYADISSMEMGKNWMGHYINFSASGNSCKMKWINNGDVHAFVDTVKAQTEIAKTKSGPGASSEQRSAPVDQLEEFRTAKVDKLLKRAKEHFHKGEEPLQTVLGIYNAKVTGRYLSYGAGIFVATNQRLLFYSKKLTGFEFESFPYANISSMEMGKNWLGAHYVNFSASGNSYKMNGIGDGDLQAFVDTVKAQTEMAKTKSGPGTLSEQRSSPVDQLQTLGKLHAAGVLTDEEFSAKKAEILAHL